ncbi:hypothetical protein [Desulfosporosinus fructosivorans]
MWDYIKGCDLSLLWQILNSKISILIFSAVITLYVVEAKKKRSKRNMLLNVLHHELIMYKPPVTPSSNDFQLPCRDKLIWSLLTSDALSSKKDKELINSLYEVAGWIEHFNYTNNYANQANEGDHHSLSFYYEVRYKYYIGMYKEIDKLIKLLRDKYKIK